MNHEPNTNGIHGNPLHQISLKRPSSSHFTQVIKVIPPILVKSFCITGYILFFIAGKDIHHGRKTHPHAGRLLKN